MRTSRLFGSPRLYVALLQGIRAKTIRQVPNLGLHPELAQHATLPEHHAQAHLWDIGNWSSQNSAMTRSRAIVESAALGDGDTHELARPKGCHQNSVDEPVDRQDFSTLKRRYEHKWRNSLYGKGFQHFDQSYPR